MSQFIETDPGDYIVTVFRFDRRAVYSMADLVPHAAPHSIQRTGREDRR